jgi:hypothetical protein
MWIEQSQSGLPVDLLGIRLGRAFPTRPPLFASTELSAVNADQIKIRSTRNEERGTKNKDEPFKYTTTRGSLLSTVSATSTDSSDSEATIQYSRFPISKFSAPVTCGSNLRALPPASRVALLHAKPLAPQPYLVKFPGLAGFELLAFSLSQRQQSPLLRYQLCDQS